MPLRTASALILHPTDEAPRDWVGLAAELDLDPAQPLLVALSGGADSVYLLDLLRRAGGAPELLAVHVDHGLRGDQSRQDQEFCRRLCHEWHVPYQAMRVNLGEQGSNLESRARDLRYQALGQCARARGMAAVVTGHHRDDAIETLLMRWMRGSALPALVGPLTNSVYPVEIETPLPGPLRLVRPLLDLRASELRVSLATRGIKWREDASNRSPRFTRNRVRHGLIPLLESVCGAGALDDLIAFQRALAGVERNLSGAVPELSWHPASRYGRRVVSLPVRTMSELPEPVLSRMLYRDLLNHTGLAPKRGVLAELVIQLRGADSPQDERPRHWNLRGGWGLRIDAQRLWLLAPKDQGGPGPGQESDC